jgi:hypothetical protein
MIAQLAGGIPSIRRAAVVQCCNRPAMSEAAPELAPGFGC